MFQRIEDYLKEYTTENLKCDKMVAVRKLIAAFFRVRNLKKDAIDEAVRAKWRNDRMRRRRV